MASPSKDPRLRARQQDSDQGLEGNTANPSASSYKRAPSASPPRDPPAERKISRSEGVSRFTYPNRSITSTIGQGQSPQPFGHAHDNSQVPQAITRLSQEEVLRLLVDFGDQSVNLALAQSELAKKESRYQHALNEYRISLQPKFQSFPAIKEQKATAHEKAEQERGRARREHADQKNHHTQTAVKIADILSLAYNKNDQLGETHARIDQMSRDLSSLKAEVATRPQDFRLEREQLLARLQALDEKLRDETSALRTRVIKNEGDATQMSQRIELSEARRQDEQRAAATAHEALETLGGRFSLLQGSQARLTKRLDGFDGTLANMEREILTKDEKLEASMDELRSNHNKTNDMINERMQHFANDDRLQVAEAGLQRIQTALQELVQKMETIHEEVQKQKSVPSHQPARTLADVYGTPAFLPVNPVKDPRRNKAPQTDLSIATGANASAVNGANTSAPGSVGPNGNVSQNTIDEIEMLKANVRSLSVRFNNLTTDSLARKMLHQLSTLYPDLQATQQNMTYIKRELDGMKTAITAVQEQSTAQHGGLQNMQQAFGTLSLKVDQTRAQDNGITQARIQELSTALGGLNHQLNALISETTQSTAKLVKNTSDLQDRVAQGEEILQQHIRNQPEDGEIQG